MFGISSTELVIIVIFGFLLFGPDKLPQMGRTIGRALRQFRETQEKMTSMVQAEVIDPMAAAANAPVKPKRTGRRRVFRRRPRCRFRRARPQGDLRGAPRPPRRREGGEGGCCRRGVRRRRRVAPLQPSPEPAAEPATEPEPEVRTTEDLYARRPRKRK